jgi:hypothetical protein
MLCLGNKAVHQLYSSRPTCRLHGIKLIIHRVVDVLLGLFSIENALECVQHHYNIQHDNIIFAVRRLKAHISDRHGISEGLNRLY